VNRFTILVGLVLAVAVVLRATVLAKDPVRRARWRIRVRLHPGPGFANMAEIQLRWSRMAALFHGRRARPDLGFPRRAAARTAAFAVRLGRAQWFHRAFSRMEDQTMILAPQRMGKTGQLADRFFDHPGAGLSITTRADVYTLTAGQRARLGPVHVWNPENVGGIPSSFRWDLVSGCEDPAVAFRRATALVGPPGTGDMAWWVEKAAVTLAALLHCAAILGADMRTVWKWANRAAPEEITTAARRPGASLELFAAAAEIQREGKSADSVRLTMTKSLAWVAVPALLDLVTGPGAVPFDAGGWALRNGTIYMIAPDGNNSVTAPLFRCFLEHIHYDASLAGTRMRYGRLPVPVLFALDEVTQTVSPPLAQWLADSAGKGILISFVCHSTGQLAERYGQHAADAIWSLAGTKLFLPGISDPDTLESVSRLCGTTGSGESERRVCPPELLRTLPENRALVISVNRYPLVIKFRPIWKRISFRLRRNPAPPRHWMTPDWAELEARLRDTTPAFEDSEPPRAWPGVITARPGGPVEGDDDRPAS
jgi:type IV secretion system protein VirD4